MLQTWLNRDEILEKALTIISGDMQGYNTFRDGSRFKENTENFKIALGFYVDHVQYIGCLQILHPNFALL